MLSEHKLVEMLVQLVSGGIAGGISTAISYPFTNVRQRAIAE